MYSDDFTFLVVVYALLWVFVHPASRGKLDGHGRVGEAPRVTHDWRYSSSELALVQVTFSP